MKRTKGWECPKCGKCFAPWVEECPECKGDMWHYNVPWYPIYPQPGTGTPWPHPDTYPWGSPRIWCGTDGTSVCNAIATTLEHSLSNRLASAISCT